MKFLRYLLVTLVVLASLSPIGLYATGNGRMVSFGWALLFGGPASPFDPNQAVAAPDYDATENWAALPNRIGPEDYVPSGINPPMRQGEAPVDLFFIHPTGYLQGDTWTFSMDPATVTEEKTRWMLANQASAYNGCCNVYAPRCRQANIHAYFKDDEVREEVLSFAYTDTKPSTSAMQEWQPIC